jgi:biotin carboxylase
MLCDLLYSKGYKVIRVLSGDLQDLLDMVPDGLNFSFEASFIQNCEVESEVAINDIIQGVQALGFPVIAVLAGAETGVELADQLSERMGLITNGTALSEARRNKFVMGETIRAAGIRAVKQLRATTWGEISGWITEWNPMPFKVIVKPMDSAGSDDVTLCQSIQDVQNAFGNIMGKINGLGLVNKAVLVQEYLEGQEYVVDMVSRDGEHKVAAIWAYDRRPANGAHFVCFGQRLLTGDDKLCPELVAYMKKVVTALGIRYVLSPELYVHFTHSSYNDCCS